MSTRHHLSHYLLFVFWVLALEEPRIADVVPRGFTETPLMRQSMNISAASSSKEDFSSTALGRMAQPAEIADTIVYLLSDKATFMTGACVSVDGGWFC